MLFVFSYWFYINIVAHVEIVSGIRKIVTIVLDFHIGNIEKNHDIYIGIFPVIISRIRAVKDYLLEVILVNIPDYANIPV